MLRLASLWKVFLKALDLFLVCTTSAPVNELINNFGTSKLKIVHDTFHHYLFGEKDFFSSLTVLVHISGLSIFTLMKT